MLSGSSVPHGILTGRSATRNHIHTSIHPDDGGSGVLGADDLQQLPGILLIGFLVLAPVVGAQIDDHHMGVVVKGVSALGNSGVHGHVRIDGADGLVSAGAVAQPPAAVGHAVVAGAQGIGGFLGVAKPGSGLAVDIVVCGVLAGVKDAGAGGDGVTQAARSAMSIPMAAGDPAMKPNAAPMGTPKARFSTSPARAE